MKWRPISTAPLDERVMVWWGKTGIDIAFKARVSGCGPMNEAWFKGDDAGHTVWVPIYWMPLPDAPPPERQ